MSVLGLGESEFTLCHGVGVRSPRCALVLSLRRRQPGTDLGAKPLHGSGEVVTSLAGVE